MSSENSQHDGRRPKLTKIHLIVSAAAFVFLVFALGFSFSSLFAAAVIVGISMIVLRVMLTREAETLEEVDDVVNRSLNPIGYASHKQNAAYDEPHSILIDVELQELLDSALSPEKMQQNSPYDPPFALTWSNIVHYLFRGKQLPR